MRREIAAIEAEASDFWCEGSLATGIAERFMAGLTTICLRIYVLFCLAGFKGNLSLLDMFCSFFQGA